MSGPIWTVIGIAPMVLFAAICIPAVVTGRRLLFGVPTAWPPGWQLRFYSSICLVVMAFGIYQTVAHGVFKEGLFITYVVTAALIGWVSYQSWKKRKERGPRDRAPQQLI